MKFFQPPSDTQIPCQVSQVIDLNDGSPKLSESLAGEPCGGVRKADEVV
jgi:hypothetical protein